MSRLPDALTGPRHGETYSPVRDSARLSRQMRAVYALMQDGQWRTLAVIAEECKASEASVSARLRDLRKLRYGGYFVERRRVRSDLWEYRLDITKSAMEHPNGS